MALIAQEGSLLRSFARGTQTVWCQATTLRTLLKARFMATEFSRMALEETQIGFHYQCAIQKKHEAQLGKKNME
jgi:hypothetical protein